MTSFTNRSKASTSFSNRENASGTRVVGDMSEQDFIDLLGAAPDFDTVIPGVVGGDKTFGELTFEDVLFAPASLWTDRSKSGASWSNRSI